MKMNMKGFCEIFTTLNDWFNYFLTAYFIGCTTSISEQKYGTGTIFYKITHNDCI